MTTKELKMEDKFKPAQDIIERNIGENICLYSPSKSLIMSLNQTANFIFKNCDGKNSLKKIVKNLSIIFKKENPERLKKDLLHIIKEMADKGFLIKV